MFSSLSFKKLRLRIRAITLFKKFAKKSSSKQKVPKQQENKRDENVEQRQVDVAPVIDAAALPQIVVSSESSLDASPAIESFGPPTPAKDDQLLIENAFAAKQGISVHEDQDVVAARNTTYSNNPKPAFVERPAQHTGNRTQDPPDMHLNKTEPVPRDYVQPIGSVGNEYDVAQGQKDVETTRMVGVDREMSEPKVVEDCSPLALKKPVRDVETDGGDSIHGDLTKPVGTEPLSPSPVSDSAPSPMDTELSIPPVVDSCATELPRHPTEPGGVVKSNSVPSSPKTLASSGNVREGSVHTPPRKRVASEVRENQEPPLLSELQASVRSREKRRLEKEKIEAEQKKKEERELRQSVAATMGIEFTVTEQGAWKTDDPVERENVLSEVRSWRKQREASLKRNVDESANAKTAAFHEALSNEAIMVDLMSTVQSRASRAPCFVDPREKRQTLLEELFARRVCVGQG